MGYNLLINGVYWGYNPLTNHLLTSWDIQVFQLGCLCCGIGDIGDFHGNSEDGLCETLATTNTCNLDKMMKKWIKKLKVFQHQKPAKKQNLTWRNDAFFLLSNKKRWGLAKTDLKQHFKTSWWKWWNFHYNCIFCHVSILWKFLFLPYPPHLQDAASPWKSTHTLPSAVVVAEVDVWCGSTGFTLDSWCWLEAVQHQDSGVLEGTSDPWLVGWFLSCQLANCQKVGGPEVFKKMEGWLYHL